MEMEEIVKLLIVIAVLVLMVGAIIILFSGKGGELLDSVRRVLRLGK